MDGRQNTDGKKIRPYRGDGRQNRDWKVDDAEL